MRDRLCRACGRRYPAMQTECPDCGVPAWMPPPPAAPAPMGTSTPQGWWGGYKARHFGPVACVRCHYVGTRRQQRETRSSGAGVVFALGVAGLFFVPLLGLALLLAALLLAVFGGSTVWHASCRACGSREVVPVCTPEGRRIVERPDAR